MKLPMKSIRVLDFDRALAMLQVGPVSFEATYNEVKKLYVRINNQGLQCRMTANRVDDEVLGYCLKLTGKAVKGRA